MKKWHFALGKRLLLFLFWINAFQDLAKSVFKEKKEERKAKAKLAEYLANSRDRQQNFSILETTSQYNLASSPDEQGFPMWEMVQTEEHTHTPSGSDCPYWLCVPEYLN